MTSVEMRPPIGRRRCSICQTVIADVYRRGTDRVDIVLRDNAARPLGHSYRCADHPERAR